MISKIIQNNKDQNKYFFKLNSQNYNMIPRFRGCGPGGRNGSLIITNATNSRKSSIKDINDIKENGKNISEEQNIE